MEQVVAARVVARNSNSNRIHWRFGTADSGIKLKRL